MTDRVLVFRVGGQEFAAEIDRVREVIAVPDVTAIPRARAPVVGVFNLRGNVVTAVDGAQALGVGASVPASRVVVADMDERLVGLLVDSASEVLRIADGDVKPSPRADAEGLTRGVLLRGDRAIVLVDLSKLIAPGEAPGASLDIVEGGA